MISDHKFFDNLSIDKLPSKALAECLRIHDGQTRKDGKTPYAVHPVRVAQHLQKLHSSSDIVQAALLHDTVEDHPDRITLDGIENWFGTSVRMLVDEMTKKQGQSRKEYINTFRTASPGACAIKLADRLDNLTDDWSWNPKFKSSYANEATELLDAICQNEIVDNTEISQVSNIVQIIDSLFDQLGVVISGVNK